MRDDAMKLPSRIEGKNVLVIEIKEDSLDVGNVCEFKELVGALIEQHTRVVFDLTDLNFIDSSGLGALISCLRQLNARKGDLRLCRLSVTVLALFELMRMTRVFGIHTTADDAVQFFV
jgi:anti-sigma B factor antagonist